MANNSTVVFTTETPWSVITAQFVAEFSSHYRLDELLRIDRKWRSLGKQAEKGFIGMKYI